MEKNIEITLFNNPTEHHFIDIKHSIDPNQQYFYKDFDNDFNQPYFYKDIDFLKYLKTVIKTRLHKINMLNRSHITKEEQQNIKKDITKAEFYISFLIFKFEDLLDPIISQTFYRFFHKTDKLSQKTFLNLIKNLIYLGETRHNIKDNKLFFNNQTFFKIKASINKNLIECIKVSFQNTICENEKNIILYDKDIEKLNIFIDSLKIFNNKPCKKVPNNSFFAKDNNFYYFTLISTNNIYYCEERIFGFIQIDKDLWIDLDRNKIMYNILERIKDDERFSILNDINKELNKDLYKNKKYEKDCTLLKNTNIEEKINAFNFYYNNSNILNVYSMLRKQRQVIKMGDPFNTFDFKDYKNNNFDYDFVIIINHSEFYKLKGRIMHDKVRIFLVFSEKSLRNFKELVNIVKNKIVEIYPGEGKLKKPIKDFHKLLINNYKKNID